MSMLMDICAIKIPQKIGEASLLPLINSLRDIYVVKGNITPADIKTIIVDTITTGYEKLRHKIDQIQLKVIIP